MDVRLRSAFCGMLLATLLAPRLAAQEPPRARPFRESVSLNTNSTVVKQLRTVRDHLSASKWSDAIDVLEQVSAAHGGTLISVTHGRYVSVGTYCQMLLAGLPAEGLAAYRTRIDPQARQWFEQGRRERDEALVQRVVRQAFASSVGDDALVLLGEWAWSRGDTAAARGYWEQALPLSEALREQLAPGDPLPMPRYPDTGHDPALLRARLVLCSVAEGDFERAFEEREDLARLHPGAEGTIAGRTGDLPELLEAAAARARHWTFAVPKSAMATFGVNAQRGGILPHTVDVGAPQWAVRLPEQSVTVPERRAQRRFPRGAPPPPTVRSVPAPLSYHPVVFGDVLLVNDGERIYGFDVHTGAPRWSRDGAAPVPPDAAVSEKAGDDAPESRRGRSAPSMKSAEAALIHTLGRTPAQPSRPVLGVPRYTMTVHGGKLYARMGSPVTGWSDGESRDLSTELRCLDLGREAGYVWHHSLENRAFEPGDWAFEGAPVVDAGRVWIALRRNHPQPQVAIRCYDAGSGRQLWHQDVCAAIGHITEGYNIITHQLLTLGGNTLFLSTDLGAIAALDARTGAFRWVVTYESRPPRSRADLSDHQKHGLTPCLYHGGVVIAAPNDSDRVLAIDAETGIVRWERRLPDRVRHLLGVGHGRVILSGDGLWGLDLDSGVVVWGGPVQDPEHYGYGRGVLAGDVVYWPTRELVHVRDQRTGQPVRQPIDLRSRGGEGGNLVVSDGVLVVAQPDLLVAYCEFGRLIERAEREIAADPDAAGPYFRLAQMPETAGEGGGGE